MAKPTHDHPAAAALIAALAPAIREIGISEIARRSGLSQAAVSHWVCGRRSPGTLGDIQRVAEAAGYTLKITLRKAPQPPDA